MEVQLKSSEGSIEPIYLVRGCLNVTFGVQTVAALCDTGASVSAIKQSFLDVSMCLQNQFSRPVISSCI
jgi:hypothetical protein